ncbi:hypothetical protein A1D23_13325 [Chelonobacter oris]|uniref:hypothetical protein n=1 Tax=Chelonobacter oris TaxID=505317 RepID=UPI002446CE98|nr:hypothetical protein [Chelonobacter oris]MDH3001566.1 hypothetical protein [Chelonobacter oris]
MNLIKKTNKLKIASVMMLPLWIFFLLFSFLKVNGVKIENKRNDTKIINILSQEFGQIEKYDNKSSTFGYGLIYFNNIYFSNYRDKLIRLGFNPKGECYCYEKTEISVLIIDGKKLFRYYYPSEKCQN